MSYGNEVLEDPSKLYCYCQLPHNDDLFYIQCDECNQWFCSKCTFLKESQLDSIILFYCIPCETITGKKTFRRRLCAAYEYTKKVEIEMEDAMDDDAETNPKSTPQLPQLLLPTAATNGTSSNLQISKRIRSPTPNQNLYTHPPTCKTYVPHESDSLTQTESTEPHPTPKSLTQNPPSTAAKPVAHL
ncbi:hypothetical protein BCR33DRAFT_655223 [Rhizoclosmatium globosum]|uniref:Uncharacterized protein n=1 Tax=Rhizoclosmatium globosum TaxID=329046 RepID=A0A1Y2D1K2_9FUNG|nr:hypothetical protein BCR33DRAFT_655223 [Rhizoclosmatium globosum]|eukprot:ORY53162.1 hypothetical protein BCR33DRAFT_655223 [Rhizoclosmatium globosum]